MVAGVEDDLDTLVREYVAERGHVVEGQGVNDKDSASGYGYLDEADSLGVAEEAVSFQIESDAGLLSQRVHYAEEAGLVLYEFVILDGTVRLSGQSGSEFPYIFVYVSGRSSGGLLAALQVAAGEVWYLHFTCIYLHS